MQSRNFVIDDKPRLQVDHVHQHLIDLSNKIERIEDRVEDAIRMIVLIGRMLAAEQNDKAKATELAIRLAEASTRLETAIGQAKKPKPA